MECGPTDRVLDALNYAKWYHDVTLAYHCLCGHDSYGSDAMPINGRNRIECKVLVLEETF